MTQTTLYSDKQLFGSLYKSALRRMKGMSLIYTLLCFITFPMPYIMEAVEAAERAANGYSYYGFNGNPEIYTTISALLYFAVIIAGSVLISIYCNSFMHNRRAVDVFHALPVKRNVLLVANFAAVATILISTQLVCYGIVAAAEMTMLDNAAFADIAAEFFRVMLLTLLIAVISFFCSVCCNASLDSVVFSGAFMAIIPAYAFLFYLIMEMFVTGFNASEDIILQTVKFSPAVMMYQTFMYEDVTQGALLNICYAAFAVVLMALSCRVYIRRKSEVAQSASTKNFLYQFIIIATSTGGGVMFGICYCELFGYYTSGIVSLILISCVFSAAIYLVFNGIMSRNARPSKRGIAGLAASVAIVVAFLICADNGFFGYESYVPATEDIKSVSINYAGDYSEVQQIYENKNGSTYWTGASDVTFTDEEEIDMVRDIHSTIVKYIGKETDLFYRSVKITYELKNGRTVSRSYWGSIPVEIMSKLAALEDSESFKTQLYPVLYADVSLVKNFAIKDGFGQNYQTLRSLTEEQKAKLYNAIAQDTLNITRQMKDQRTGPVFARISVNYKESSEAAQKALAQKAKAAGEAAEITVAREGVEPVTDGYPVYENVVFDVTQDCINTIRVLEELGLSQYTALTVPENMKAVVLAATTPLDYNTQRPYWLTNTDIDQYNLIDAFRWEDVTRVAEYTDSAQVAQLVQNSQVSLYAPRQNRTFYAVMFVENDVDWRGLEVGEYDCMVYYISSNKAPDFVKEDLQEFDYENYFAHYGTME